MCDPLLCFYAAYPCIEHKIPWNMPHFHSLALFSLCLRRLLDNHKFYFQIMAFYALIFNEIGVFLLVKLVRIVNTHTHTYINSSCQFSFVKRHTNTMSVLQTRLSCKVKWKDLYQTHIYEHPEEKDSNDQYLE